MRLPDFLVIGGMKCGSTTLYRDLLGHPEISIPEKELNFFSNAGKDVEGYLRRFRDIPASSICGDVSTTYSMLPDFTGTAERAAELLTNKPRIIYLVREPVSRALSHHRHMHAWHGPGKMGSDVNVALQDHPSILNYNRYATQLEPWCEAFGDDSVRVVIFEEYTRDRHATVSDLTEFLGVRRDTQHVCADRVFNQSDGKTVLNPFWLGVWKTPLYQKMIRPLMSLDIRELLRTNVLPGAPNPVGLPTMETVDRIIEDAWEQEFRLRKFMDRGEPIWDFADVRAKFRDSQGRTPRAVA